MLSRWRDLLPGLILIAGVVALFAVTTTFPTVPPAFAQGMQATAMPRLILGVIALLAVILIAQGYGKSESAKPAISIRVWATAALLVAGTLAFEWLGLTLTTALTCFAMPLLWGERRIVRVGVFAVLTPLLIYLLFTHVLQLRLPQGILTSLLN